MSFVHLSVEYRHWYGTIGWYLYMSAEYQLPRNRHIGRLLVNMLINKKNYVDQHLTKCQPTCRPICRPIHGQYAGWHLAGISVDCVLKLGQGSWGSVLCIRYRGRRFENSFCSVVHVIPHQPHWVSLSDFCHGSTHFLMLHCPWIPLKCDAIAVPIFSKKQKYQTSKIRQSPLKIASCTPQQLQFE